VIPRRDPRDRSRPQILAGETPNPISVPSGCRFHPRCPAVFDRCPTDDPVELLPTGEDGHGAACWLLEQR
jgi:peptide/nickel transport system ATP-binding protein